MTTETMREAVARAIGYEMAPAVSGNNMPHASGDPRNRLSPLQRRSFDRAVQYATDAAIRTVLERLREPGDGILKIGTTAIADYYNDPEAEPPNTDEMRAGWQAMLDAAVREVG